MFDANSKRATSKYSASRWANPKRTRFRRLLALIVCTTIGASLLTACSSGNKHTSASGAKTTNITFMLDTNFLPKHGLFFAAAGFGFYKAQGLNVSIQPSAGSTAGAAAVAAGKAQFSFGDFDTVAGTIGKGAKVKEIGEIHAISPNAFVTLKKTGITSISQLVGKTVAVEPNVGFDFELPAEEQLCGLPVGSIKVINVASTAKDATLISGKADAIMAYTVSDPPAMVGEGYDPVSLPWSVCGWTGYSNGLVASTSEIQNNPDLVRKFVLATMQGIQYACTHVEAAGHNSLKYAPSMTLKAAEAGITDACGIIWTPEAKANGMGYMSSDGANTTLGLAYKYLKLPKTVTAADVMTDEFIPKILQGTVVNTPSGS